MPDHCPQCPFRGCPECLYRGGENVAAQRDSQPELWDNGAEHGAAPERCVNTAEGLTLTQLPMQPGGISG